MRDAGRESGSPPHEPAPPSASASRSTDSEEARLLADEQVTMFTASVDARTTATRGQPLRLAVDPSAFHFFDPVAGLRLEHW